MANLNDLDLKICASESDVPSEAPEKDQLILVGGEGGGAAEDISYDNTDSGLVATDLQAAVDELAGQIGGGSGGGSTTPQIEGVPSVLQPNVSYWEEPTADKTFTFAAPTEGIVNHYHVLWFNEGGYTPTFTTVAGDGLSHGWSVLCGEPPSPLPTGWYEFSFLYADTVLLGMWAKVSDV